MVGGEVEQLGYEQSLARLIDVDVLRSAFCLPGMHAVQFASDGPSDNPRLPHNYHGDSIAYTGTHDSSPTRVWFEKLPSGERANVWNCLKRFPGSVADVAPALIELASSSPATFATAPLQDLLNPSNEARINVPGHGRKLALAVHGEDDYRSHFRMPVPVSRFVEHSCTRRTPIKTRMLEVKTQ